MVSRRRDGKPRRLPTLVTTGKSRWVTLGVCIIGLLSTVPMIRGQADKNNVGWSTYGGDLGNRRYSPLDQIDASNFAKLGIAWRFKTDNLGPRPEFQFESTPLVVKGVLYSTAGTRRSVVALNAETGELLW